MSNRIILHTGATKTGTSALQVGLAQNQQPLLDQGVFAPSGRQFEKSLVGAVTGGNAKPIISFGRALRNGADMRRRDPEKQLRNWLKQILSMPGAKKAQTVVFSGEAIPGSFDVDAFCRLKDIFSDHFDEIQIIYYVRHLTDHAISQYGEYVRRRRMKLSFTEFVPNYTAPFLEAISKMEEVFGRAHVQVLLFDTERQNLWSNFVRLLGADPIGMCKPVEVNRSLCAEEIMLIRDLNRLGIKRTLLAKTLTHYSGKIRPATVMRNPTHPVSDSDNIRSRATIIRSPRDVAAERGFVMSPLTSLVKRFGSGDAGAVRGAARAL